MHLTMCLMRYTVRQPASQHEEDMIDVDNGCTGGDGHVSGAIVASKAFTELSVNDNHSTPWEHQSSPQEPQSRSLLDFGC